MSQVRGSTKKEHSSELCGSVVEKKTFILT